MPRNSRMVLAVVVALACVGLTHTAFADAPAGDTPAQIECNVMRLRAEQQVKAAFHGDGHKTDWALAQQGGEGYLAIWQKHGEAPLRAGAAPACRRLDEVLYNAQKAFQLARLLPQRVAVVLIMIDPASGLRETQFARRVVFELASLYWSIGEYGEAAVWLERFARENAGAEQAPGALRDAIVLRLGLGQPREADGDVERFGKAYGASKRALYAHLSFALAQFDVKAERWGAAEKRLAAVEARIDRDATLDVQLQAHAVHGRALVRLGRGREATVQFGLVLGLARDARAMIRRIEDGVADDPRPLASALDAVGEARVYLAAEAAKGVLALRIPAYVGVREQAAVTRWVREALEPALAQRRAAIEVAEKHHVEAMRIEPFMPPRWAVATSVAVTHLWADLADELGALAAGPAGKRSDLLLAEALALQREVARTRALGAAHACIATVVRFQYTSAEARFCETWLSRETPRERPRFDEIVPQPRWLLQGTPDPLPPVVPPDAHLPSDEPPY
jgi:hypothetical protein